MKVLAFLDSSHYALGVCDHAAWAAKKLSLPVEVAHILERQPSDPRIAVDRSGRLGIDSREALLKQIVELDEQRNRLAHESGRRLLDEAAARMRENGAAQISQRLLHGEVVDQLRHHEDGVTLVVIGKQGEGAEHAAAHLGSNLERVIRASRQPVLVASRDFRPIRRFMLAFDGGASSGRAIDFLVNHPLLNDAEGHLLMVSDDSGDHRHRVSDATARLRASGLSISDDLRPGDPDVVILEAVARLQCDLLIMGAYGHSRVRNLMVGSTTTTLLRESPVPLLIVR